MSTKFRAQIVKETGVSNREAEVIELVTKGLSNKEIGNQLFITEKTVKFHLCNVYRTVNVSSRAQLIVKFLPQLTWENLGHE
jgi:DNA-binding NarL/FixJ family response regulator